MYSPVPAGVPAVNVIRVALVKTYTSSPGRHSNINWSHATRRPKNSEIRNKTRNTPNRSLAIPAAAPAMLEKPSKAATSAMIRKKTDQDNTCNSFDIHNYKYLYGRYQFMMFLNESRNIVQHHRAFP